jgi:hypothetical protein
MNYINYILMLKKSIKQQDIDENKFLDELIEINKNCNNETNQIDDFDIVKNFFEPHYKVLNYSDKSKKEISNVIKFCVSNNKVIVFIKRTNTNVAYFKRVEAHENTTHKVEKITSIFLNKDNYYYFTDNKSYVKNDGRLQFVKKAINNENICCYLCHKMFEGYKTGLSCNKCGNVLCNECLLKSEVINSKLKCPVCNENIIHGDINFIKKAIHKNNSEQKVMFELNDDVMNKILMNSVNDNKLNIFTDK